MDYIHKGNICNLSKTKYFTYFTDIYTHVHIYINVYMCEKLIGRICDHFDDLSDI